MSRPVTATELLQQSAARLYQNSPSYRRFVATERGKRTVSALYDLAARQPAFTVDVLTAALRERLPLVRRLSVHLEREGRGAEAVAVLGMDPEAFCEALTETLEGLEASLAGFSPEHRQRWLRKPEQLDLAHQQLGSIRAVDRWLRHYAQEFTRWELTLPKEV
jgi:hypothetical protein